MTLYKHSFSVTVVTSESSPDTVIRWLEHAPVPVTDHATRISAEYDPTTPYHTMRVSDPPRYTAMTMSWRVGRTRTQEQRLDRHRLAMLRHLHRSSIYQLDGGRCRCCGTAVLLASDDPFRLGHVHEEPPRSLGGDPLNPAQTLLLCARCHGARHSGRLRLEVEDQVRGCRGPVRFVGQEDSEHAISRLC
mgnify:CR=1 FL=1